MISSIKEPPFVNENPFISKQKSDLSEESKKVEAISSPHFKTGFFEDIKYVTKLILKCSFFLLEQTGIIYLIQQVWDCFSPVSNKEMSNWRASVADLEQKITVSQKAIEGRVKPLQDLYKRKNYLGLIQEHSPAQKSIFNSLVKDIKSKETAIKNRKEELIKQEELLSKLYSESNKRGLTSAEKVKIDAFLKRFNTETSEIT